MSAFAGMVQNCFSASRTTVADGRDERSRPVPDCKGARYIGGLGNEVDQLDISAKRYILWIYETKQKRLANQLTGLEQGHKEIGNECASASHSLVVKLGDLTSKEFN